MCVLFRSEMNHLFRLRKKPKRNAVVLFKNAMTKIQL